MSAEDKETVFNRELKNGAILLSILTAILYLNGTSFRAGYLQSYGLPNMFTYTFERTLLVGVSSFALLLLKIVMAISPGILLMLTALFILCWLYIRKSHRMQRVKQRVKNPFDWKISPFSPYEARIIWLISSLLAVFILFEAIIYASTNVGREFADRQKKDWDSDLQLGAPNAANELVLVTFQLRSSDRTTVKMMGGFITSSDSYCGIYTAEGVIIIPKERIEHIKILKK